MSKFKVGDKVRCVDSSSSAKQLKVGNVYTIKKIYKCFANGAVVDLKEVEESGHSLIGYSVKRFELVSSADDLDSLIAQANDLLPKLHARREEIECSNRTYPGWSSVDKYLNYELRRKAPALPSSFTLPDKGYEVVFTDANTVKVGCRTFDKLYLQQGLGLLIKNNAHGFVSADASIKLFANKTGVSDGDQITWADADALLAALEKTSDDRTRITKD